VRQGQLLFRIDPRQYQAAVEQARGQLDQAQAGLDNDEKDLERDRVLFKKQVVARQTLDTANAQTEEARANVAAAKAALDTALLNLGYTNIHAPIAGRIGVAQVKVGALVQQGTTLLDTIYSIDPIYVNFSVTEQTYLRYAEMAAKADHAPPPPPVQLLLPDNRTYEYEGKIDMSTPSVSSSTGTLGVRAVFPNPQGILRAGLFVRVRVMVREERNAVMVPVQAVAEVQGQQHVLIAGADNKVELRPIKAGATAGNMRVIASGVRPGERVIVEGLQKAQPGMAVNVEEHPPPVIPGQNQAGGQSAQQPPATLPQASASPEPSPPPR
jgi:membrane fusion protein (multidrug efflux system)